MSKQKTNIRPPRKEGRAAVPTRRQFNNAMQRCDGYPHALRNKAFLVCIFALGLRPKEIASLKLGDIYDFETDELVEELTLIKSYTKKAKTRTLPIDNDLLHEHLLRYIHTERRDRKNRYNKAAALILSQRGGPFSPNSIGNLAHDILAKRANIHRASTYSGRRSFATTMARNKVDVRTIQHLMGHENLATTQIYLESDPVLMREAMKSVI